MRLSLRAQVLVHDGYNLLVVVRVSIEKLVRTIIPHKQKTVHYSRAFQQHISDLPYGERLR